MKKEEELMLKFLGLLVDYGYIPKHFKRNIEIKMEYDSLRQRNVKDRKQILAEKYCTSVKNIEKILWERKY